MADSKITTAAEMLEAAEIIIECALREYRAIKKADERVKVLAAERASCAEELLIAVRSLRSRLAPSTPSGKVDVEGLLAAIFGDGPMMRRGGPMANHVEHVIRSYFSRPSPPSPVPVTVEVDSLGEPRIYPCRLCPTMRSKSEGGTTFTVCDECWETEAARRKPAVPVTGAVELIERIGEALKRVTHASRETRAPLMRIPPHPTDPDVVLADCREFIEAAARRKP